MKLRKGAKGPAERAGSKISNAETKGTYTIRNLISGAQRRRMGGPI